MSSDVTRDRAIALGCCSLLPASWDKRFIRSMVAIANVDTAAFTELQAANIDRLAWKYRRQIPARLIPSSNPGQALGLTANSTRSR